MQGLDSLHLLTILLLAFAHSALCQPLSLNDGPPTANLTTAATTDTNINVTGDPRPRVSINAHRVGPPRPMVPFATFNRFLTAVIAELSNAVSLFDYDTPIPGGTYSFGPIPATDASASSPAANKFTLQTTIKGTSEPEPLTWGYAWDSYRLLIDQAMRWPAEPSWVFTTLLGADSKGQGGRKVAKGKVDVLETPGEEQEGVGQWSQVGVPGNETEVYQ